MFWEQCELTPVNSPEDALNHAQDIRDERGCTALATAAHAGNSDFLKLLLAAEANPDVTTEATTVFRVVAISSCLNSIENIRQTVIITLMQGSVVYVPKNSDA